MKIAVLNETKEGEARCAISPDAVAKFIKLGAEVRIHTGAGAGSNISDAAFEAAGAKLLKSNTGVLKEADIVLCVNGPDDKQLESIPGSALLIGSLGPLSADAQLSRYTDKAIVTFAMELLPRISRAQSMDVLSSQSNLAGYRAVIDAVATHAKAIPMMMTAAGTVPPAKVLVLGAGVAGLQAIATAKRLGAVVSAFDVRPAVKEQVESLGAKFIEVEAEPAEGEDGGGYAKEMSDDYKHRQSELIANAIKSQDIVITTALIPGKPAPELITKQMVIDMKDGGVIVDLAAPAGGNCALTEPGNVVMREAITLIGYTNYPSRCAADATPLYARNLFNFVSTLMLNAEKQFEVNWEDELVVGTLLTKEGAVVHPMVREVHNG